MNHHHSTHHTTQRMAKAACAQAAPWWAGLLAAACLVAPSFAADDRAQVEASLARERAACMAGQSQQDTKTCLQEVKGARLESRRGGLEGDASTYASNLLLRCERLPADDKRDCLARMQGQGTTQGSVAAGGILRTLVTREVMPTPAAAVPLPAPMPAPAASSPASR